MNESTRESQGQLPRAVADRYVAMVRRHAYRLARRLPSHVSVEDLMGAGFVGLADALKKYDRSGPDRFEAYADFRIRGAMLDELRSYDPLSRDLRDLNNRMVAVVRGLTASLGRPPEEPEIAKGLDIPVALFRERLAKLSFGGLVSLDTTGGDGADGLELGSDDSEAAEAQLMRAERRSRLETAIETLPERLRTLLRLYYEQDYTLREIGEMLGVTESRACQLHAEAILRLRASCAQEEKEEAARGEEEAAELEITAVHSRSETVATRKSNTSARTASAPGSTRLRRAG